MPLWLGMLAWMAAGAAVAVPLIGAPLPTCGVLLLLGLVWIARRRRQDATAAGPVLRPADLLDRSRPAPCTTTRQAIAGSPNRHAA